MQLLQPAFGNTKILLFASNLIKILLKFINACQNKQAWESAVKCLFHKYKKMPVVRDASNLGTCAGSASDLRRICVGFASDSRRICVGVSSDLRRIWWGILTLALAKTTSSIPRQSDEVALKPNLCRATKLRV